MSELVRRSFRVVLRLIIASCLVLVPAAGPLVAGPKAGGVEATTPPPADGAPHRRPSRARAWWEVDPEDLRIPNADRMNRYDLDMQIAGRLTLVEPYRLVDADEWHSPLCLVWDDGCRRCARRRVADEPVCSALEGAPKTCRKRIVECRAVDARALKRLCATHLVIPPTGSSAAIETCERGRGCVASPLAAEPEPKSHPFWEGYAGDKTNLPAGALAGARTGTNTICVGARVD